MADRKNAKRPPAKHGLFDKMLKKPCPYHRGPTKHTLEECTILHCFYSNAPLKENAEEPPKDNDDNAEGEGFPKVRNCLLIFGRRNPPYREPEEAQAPRGLHGQHGHSGLPQVVGEHHHLRSQ